VSSEYVVRLDDGTELCAITSTSDGDALGIAPGEQVWAVFNGFAVILHADN
jgi:molybdate transport system regulatory protein